MTTDYSKKKNTELEEMPKARPLPYTGKKAKLIARLQQSDMGDASTKPAATKEIPPEDEIDWDNDAVVPKDTPATSKTISKTSNTTIPAKAATIPAAATAIYPRRSHRQQNFERRLELDVTAFNKMSLPIEGGTKTAIQNRKKWCKVSEAALAQTFAEIEEFQPQRGLHQRGIRTQKRLIVEISAPLRSVPSTLNTRSNTSPPPTGLLHYLTQDWTDIDKFQGKDDLLPGPSSKQTPSNIGSSPAVGKGPDEIASTNSDRDMEKRMSGTLMLENKANRSQDDSPTQMRTTGLLWKRRLSHINDENTRSNL
ncbi:MAG: hypothetical protein LQ350_007450 [Teloschistes chrysophthalmus]|nr:MAG: hypothetical protein LQ350_007450 [Niorma chrysophthalma]